MDDSERNSYHTIEFQYGPVWIDGRLRYTTVRFHALRKYLIDKGFKTVAERLPISAVEQRVVINSANVNTVNVLLNGKLLRKFGNDGVGVERMLARLTHTSCSCLCRLHQDGRDADNGLT